MLGYELLAKWPMLLVILRRARGLCCNQSGGLEVDPSACLYKGRTHWSEKAPEHPIWYGSKCRIVYQPPHPERSEGSSLISRRSFAALRVTRCPGKPLIWTHAPYLCHGRCRSRWWPYHQILVRGDSIWRIVVDPVAYLVLLGLGGVGFDAVDVDASLGHAAFAGKACCELGVEPGI